MWGFMGGGRGALPDRFEEQYHCYSAAMADKANLEVREPFTVVCGPILMAGDLLRRRITSRFLRYFY